MVLVVVLAAVGGFSAWAVWRHGSLWVKAPLFVAVALPTLFAVYVVLGLVGHAVRS